MQTKAKAIRKYVDKMIGLAKEGTLHARRQALAFVYDEDLVKSLFEQVGGRVGAGWGAGACWRRRLGLLPSDAPYAAVAAARPRRRALEASAAVEAAATARRILPRAAIRWRHHRSHRRPPARPVRLPQVPARYAERPGGYCRVKAEIQPRRGDNVEMATLELV